MNRTARRIRSISAATLALTAAGLTLGSVSAPAAPRIPLPTNANPMLPTIRVLPTILPVVSLPTATIKPGLVGMTMSLNTPVGPVARGTNYSYSMTVETNAFGTGIVTLGHTVPPELTGVAWTCTASGGANCGSSTSGTGSIFAVLTTPTWSTVTFNVSGTIAAEATNFQLVMTTFTATVRKRTIDVAVHVPAVSPKTPAR